MESEYGHPWLFFHRVDLHNGLKELAFCEDGDGRAVELRLGSRVVDVVSTTCGVVGSGVLC